MITASYICSAPESCKPKLQVTIHSKETAIVPIFQHGVKGDRVLVYDPKESEPQSGEDKAEVSVCNIAVCSWNVSI